jgi:very-short-patch-repair endonuclease
VDPPSPFDSWFEVDVALVLLRKHYTVLAQYEVAGKRIDLVIEGGHARLAVECDGDRWHGPEQYEADMQRQRQLERCGWEFFRVSEAAFYSNEEDALTPLWQMLEERGIVPDHGATGGDDRTADNDNGDDDNEQEEEEDDREQDEQGPATSDGAPNTQSRRHPEEVSGHEISDAIINILRKCPNQSCTLHSLTSRVLKEVGVLTRGKPRERFDKRVNRVTNSLCQKGRIEKYKAKNERVRLLQKKA